MFPFQAIHNQHLAPLMADRMSKSYYQCFLFKQFTTENNEDAKKQTMSKSYYQCFLFKQFTTAIGVFGHIGRMSKSYYQCFLFKQFTTGGYDTCQLIGCQRAIINVSFSSNSQQNSTRACRYAGCQRAIINVSFSSNSQLLGAVADVP